VDERSLSDRASTAVPTIAVIGPGDRDPVMGRSGTMKAA
jgi:hypothetical protein